MTENPDPTYADTTYLSANALQRFAHRSRLKIALGLAGLQPGETLLDYGCGDGKFLNDLAVLIGNADRLVGYDPYTPAAFQANIYHDREVLVGDHPQFDVIVCLEVLEHLNVPNQRVLLQTLVGLLRPGGRVIVSVPVEIYFPALVKNLRRRYGGSPDPQYSARNIVYSVFGASSRLSRLRSSGEYLSHMGFDHRRLERTLQRYFTIERKLYSPFRWGRSAVNSQVFYVLRTRLRDTPRSP